MTDPRNPWLARFRPAGDGAIRLICFPHAGGGGATFRDWADDLPPEIDLCGVRFPARESRLREKPYLRMDELVPALAEGLADDLARPYALLGYCSGALVAWELAAFLARSGRRPPELLAVFAFPAPALVEPTLVHRLPTEQLTAHLRGLGVIPDAILADPGLFSMFETGVRADYEVFETWTRRAEPPLTVPVTVFGGAADPSVTVPELAAWRAETSGEFTLRVLAGDHSFFTASRRRLTGSIAADLLAVRAVNR
ncbi:thioesterase [Acrocarpospora pleiomorpha]|uniref:Thioesterase n=1 Tax=Acrocarpospora pleiomorpha TaxID=90975 RepID=A0A5M3XTV1_9ACTN|nr:thioesterase domain-containing protein [Acrocarpospora pleiomorpha]GES24306.1 thioesterase [Acrocarpospora pleiomorpha]